MMFISLYPWKPIPLPSNLNMASSPPKSLKNWLQQRSNHLSGLLDRAHLLRRVTGILRHALPEPLSAHCLAANIDGDTLVVGCDSPIWATKLRYHIPHLLGDLRAQPGLGSFSQIRIRVQPHSHSEEQARGVYRRFKLSESSALLINNVADNTADPDLKAALRRLSQHAKSAKKP
jgi:hypothetical protein